jgi:poly(A)-specific ribonuclease
VFFLHISASFQQLKYATLITMNVDRHNFPSQLLNILESIASADFIAIDFEFSGVARNNSKHSGRTIQTLQERYVEVKAAASRYQILQVGITTAHQIFPSRTRIVNLDDIPEQSFELRTYNIDLCPTIEDDLEVDRDFVLQSSAAEFLLANRFNFEKPFTHGLRYLSRAEEAVARQAAKSRSDKSRFGPIQLSEEDTDALAFVEKVRMEVQEWLDEYRRSDTLWIMSRLVHWRKAPPLSSSGRPSPEHELTGFNKKLVHQLLKAEFPELIALSRASGMVISHIDPAREKQLAKNRARRANDHINIQIGFRWIAEALCGGSIRDINLKSLAVDEHGNRTNFDFYESSRRHSDITRKLESHKPVLVGHNAFGDLIYLYQNFLGDLPDTVEEFGSLIRGIFPVVVDTKYMATHDSGSATSSSLDQIMSNLENEMRPKISQWFFFNINQHKLTVSRYASQLRKVSRE